MSRSTVRLRCKECGKEFDKYIGEYDRWVRKGRDYFFCSLSCAAKYSNKSKKAPDIIRKCPVCGKEFHTVAWGKRSRKGCSRSCASTRPQTEETKLKISNAVHLKWKEDPEYAAKCSKNWTLDGTVEYFTSQGERELRQFFQSEYPSQNWTWGGRLLVNGVAVSRDLYSDTMETCIEYDGVWHFIDITGQLEDKISKDNALEYWCDKNGYRLIRIEDEVYKEDPAFWQERVAREVSEGTEALRVFYRLEHTKH